MFKRLKSLLSFKKQFKYSLNNDDKILFHGTPKDFDNFVSVPGELLASDEMRISVQHAVKNAGYLFCILDENGQSCKLFPEKNTIAGYVYEVSSAGFVREPRDTKFVKNFGNEYTTMQNKRIINRHSVTPEFYAKHAGDDVNARVVKRGVDFKKAKSELLALENKVSEKPTDKKLRADFFQKLDELTERL